MQIVDPFAPKEEEGRPQIVDPFAMQGDAGPKIVDPFAKSSGIVDPFAEKQPTESGGFFGSLGTALKERIETVKF